MKRTITMLKAAPVMLLAVMLSVSCQKNASMPEAQANEEQKAISASSANSATFYSVFGPTEGTPSESPMISYPIYSQKKEVIGNFSIVEDVEKDGLATIVISLNENYPMSRESVLGAYISDDNGSVYADLNDITGEKGYSETFPVYEKSTGNMLRAKELYEKYGYTLSINQKDVIIGSGTIGK
jgi:hypothetical protein